MINNLSNEELLKKFNTKVFGHLKAKKALISLVNRSKLSHYIKYLKDNGSDSDFPTLEPSKCLLVGPSGTGKTFLVESLQDLVHFPLIKVDATAFELSGRQGLNVEKLQKLIRSNAVDLVNQKDNAYFSVEATVDQTVVFVDEVDKLAISFDSTGNWNNMIQSSFLTMFGGCEGFESVSFIFAGAFSSMRHMVTSKAIGFTAAHMEDEAFEEQSTDEMIIAAGLMPEFVGRINTIVNLDTLGKKEFTSILKTILIPAKSKELELFGYKDYKFSRKELKDIVDQAIKSKQGVRSLKRELNSLVLELEFGFEKKPKRLTKK
ncbi:AAA family ATPase [Candidatus Babeliales bacterium]|nr:AAA family ATPase [Candidatus Babeliales bacterium]